MRKLKVYSRLDSFDKYLLSTFSLSDTGSFYQLCFVLLKTIAPCKFPLSIWGQINSIFVATRQRKLRDYERRWVLKVSLCHGVGPWTLRVFEGWALGVVSWKMSLPYKSLGPETNNIPQRSCPGWLQEVDMRTIPGSSIAKGQCLCPPVLEARISVVGFPSKSEIGILEKVAPSFPTHPLNTRVWFHC